MSNKNIITTVWNAPTSEEVNEVVQSLGGINAVCRIAKKHRNTVSRWCSGDIQIDYANWHLISGIKGNKIVTTLSVGVSADSMMVAIQEVGDIVSKYDMKKRDLEAIQESFKKAMIIK